MLLARQNLVALPGIEVVHNLNDYPWPWADGSVDEINLYDVLEHLDDFMKAIEEIFRILTQGGVVISACPTGTVGACPLIRPTSAASMKPPFVFLIRNRFTAKIAPITLKHALRWWSSNLFWHHLVPIFTYPVLVK